MEVVLCAKHNSLVLGNALDLVSPFAGDLDAGLNSLGTSVHGQDHVEAEIACNKLGKAREDVIVESTGAQSDTRSLIHECSNQLGVAVTLVHCGVGGEEV